MSHHGITTLDNDQVRPEHRRFFESFYKVSDVADSHQGYADHFTLDAKLVMASKKADGRNEIIAMRHSMWDRVSKRSHKPAKIFVSEQGSAEFMLNGTVDYELKDGRKVENVEWAALAHLVTDCGEPKMDFYQVYMVRTP